MITKSSFWVWVVLVCCSLSNLVYANLRPPEESIYPPSQALKKTGADLVVMHEDLYFDLATPFSSYKHSLLEKNYYAKIHAHYVVQSPKEQGYTFEFVMAEPNTAIVEVNEKQVKTVSPVPFIRDENVNHVGEDFRPPRQLWIVAFIGQMKSGENHIRVRYQQPLSTKEVDYGHWGRSKWMSFVDYELWPLKGWTLGSKFTMDVELLVEDDTSFLRRWYTHDHTLKALALVPRMDSGKGSWDEFEIIGSASEYPRGKVKKRFHFGRHFPDRLRVLSTEFDEVKYPTYVP